MGTQNTQGESHHEHHDHHEEPMTPQEVVRSLLVLGQVALNAGDYESAVEAYASALQLERNDVALCNLASLYARGLGVSQDYREAAQLYHEAELLGNGLAAKLCAKCMFDYIDANIQSATPAKVYAAMAVFVSQVYPEATDQRQEVRNGLTAIGNTYLSKGEQDAANKVFTALDEFCD